MSIGSRREKKRGRANKRFAKSKINKKKESLSLLYLPQIQLGKSETFTTCQISMCSSSFLNLLVVGVATWLVLTVSRNNISLTELTLKSCVQPWHSTLFFSRKTIYELIKNQVFLISIYLGKMWNLGSVKLSNAFMSLHYGRLVQENAALG